MTISNQKFNLCVEKIAEVLDEYLGIRVEDVTQINNCVVHYADGYDYRPEADEETKRTIELHNARRTERRPLQREGHTNT